MAGIYGDISQPAPPLPQPQLKVLRPGITLLLPLSRAGIGPGLLILVPNHEKQLKIEHGVPSPLYKWAEEGYVVVEIQESALRHENAVEALNDAVDAIQACEKCNQRDKIGLLSYDHKLWEMAAGHLPSIPAVVAAAVYAGTSPMLNPSFTGGDSSTSLPLLMHIPGNPSSRPSRKHTLTEHYYPAMKSHKFALPFQDEFNYSSESVSHTRNLTFLKKHMNGPFFDLEDIWEEHTYYEFADRSVEWTMSTMVQEPYVNHVPTLTGGIGRESLTKFYRDNFIFSNSADTELELISRTVGIDRVIDEFLFKFTHDQVIDWLLPGVPPSFKKASVPFTAVVNIRGDRLYHEHIAWDQGTLLRQLGLMPEYLPYPYPLPNDQAAKFGGLAEYRVPVGGVETADKMRERNSVASNEMFKFQIREA